MKICLYCQAHFAAEDWKCPSCNQRPETLAGFPAFAPDLAATNTGFRPDFFDELSKLEARNFWFRGRNRLITWALQRYFPTAENLLEIGCGTGFVLSDIEKSLPHMTLTGSEIFTSGLVHAASRLPKAPFFQMDARVIPFDGEFDVIGAFDVLEHIQDDRMVLKQMYQATGPQGGIILTVPQHPSLWSPTDESACHVRRYTANELEGKVTQAGFTVTRKTSFVSLLLPLMMLSRFKKRKRANNDDVMDELRTKEPVNTILEKVLDLERTMIRMGINFPAGGSLLLVAQKGHMP